MAKMRSLRPAPTRRATTGLPYRRPILFALLGYVALGSAWNFLIGASPLNVALVDACILLVPLAMYTVPELDILTVLFCVLVFRQVGLAFLLKPIAGQSLDSHMIYPTQTLYVTLAGLCMALVATRLALFAFRFLPKIRFPEDDRSYLVMTILAGALGVIGAIDQARLINDVANRAVANTDAAGLGSFLPVFLTLALVLATGRAVRRRGARWVTDPMLLTLIAVQILQGLALNGRTGIGLALVVPVVSAVAFGFRPRLGTIVAVLAGLTFFVTVASPIIISLRSHRDKQSAAERVSAALAKFGSAGDSADADTGRGPSGTPFYDYFGVRPDVVRERIAMVKHTDVVVVGVREFGRVNSDLLNQSVINVLPRFTGVEKQSGVTIGNRIYCRLGWSAECLGDNKSTMPIVAESYAIGGLYQGMVIAFVCFLIMSFALGIGGFNIQNNVLAVFCLLQYGNTFTEGDTGGAALVVRSCIILVVIVPILLLISSFIAGVGRRTAAPPQARVRTVQAAATQLKIEDDIRP